MKNIIYLFIISLFICTGCKTIPSEANVYTVSYAVGAASANIVDKTDINEKTSNAIIKTLDTIKIYVPSTNETFTIKWIPIVNTRIKNLVLNNELTPIEAVYIEKTFNIICNGLDYIFEERYPNIKTYENLMISAIHGFSSGFSVYFNNKNIFTISNDLNVLDQYEYLKAYEYLKFKK